MRRNLSARLLQVVSFAILVAMPLMDHAQRPVPRVGQPTPPYSVPADPYAQDFAGVDYTDEQKEAIKKIREDMAMRRAAVMKDDKLSADQKDAMLTGYLRMEYGSIFKQLTPEQKKEVSAKMRARHAADQAAQKKRAAPTK